MPIMVIAKKSCRVMIEPPEKGAGDRQSVDTEAYQQQISLSGKYQSARRLFFPDKPSLPPRGIGMMMQANIETTCARAATETRQDPIGSKRVDEPCRSSVVGRKRKLDPKRCATPIPIFPRYLPIMRFDDGSRDGQPHAHAFRLAGEKRFEDLF